MAQIVLIYKRTKISSETSSETTWIALKLDLIKGLLAPSSSLSFTVSENSELRHQQVIG